MPFREQQGSPHTSQGFSEPFFPLILQDWAGTRCQATQESGGGLSPAFITHSGRTARGWAAWNQLLCHTPAASSQTMWTQSPLLISSWGWEDWILRPCNSASLLGLISEPPGGYSPCHRWLLDPLLHNGESITNYRRIQVRLYSLPKKSHLFLKI